MDDGETDTPTRLASEDTFNWITTDGETIKARIIADSSNPPNQYLSLHISNNNDSSSAAKSKINSFASCAANRKHMDCFSQ